MNDPIYERIQANPRFQELVAKRERFAWLLSIIVPTPARSPTLNRDTDAPTSRTRPTIS